MPKDRYDKAEIGIKGVAALAAVSLPALVAYYGNSITTADKTKERVQSDFQFKQKQQQDTFQFTQKQEQENFQFRQNQILKKIQLDQEESQKKAELRQQNYQKELELGQKYIEIAVAILKNEPTPETQPIRKWAIATMNKYAEVKLSDAQIKILQERPITNVNVDISGIGSSFSLGKLKASTTVKIAKGESRPAFGDQLVIKLNKIENASGTLTVVASLQAPGKEEKAFSGQEGSCLTYSGLSIRVHTVTSQNAEFEISREASCD